MRKTGIKVAFGALVATQAAHSLEEYRGRLWESFPPADVLTRLISDNQEVGFAIANVSLILFGLWCVLVPVRLEWPSARALIWLWIGIETINGIGHPVWSFVQGGYTPGVATAPILLVLAIVLAWMQSRGVTGTGPS